MGGGDKENQQRSGENRVVVKASYRRETYWFKRHRYRNQRPTTAF
jgi:hypothetical protein